MPKFYDISTESELFDRVDNLWGGPRPTPCQHQLHLRRYNLPELLKRLEESHNILARLQLPHMQNIGDVEAMRG
jgi:hypothetical protein